MKTNLKRNIDSLAKYIEHNYSINNQKNIKKLIKNKPINTLVEAIEKIDEINVIRYFLICTISEKNNLIGQFFSALKFEKKNSIIETSNSKLIKQIFEDLEVNDAFDFIHDVSKDLKKRILISISPEVRKDIVQLSKYEESEIGGIMNSLFLKCELEWTVAKATQYISNNREEISINGTLYVVNHEGELEGNVQIHDILLEKDKNKLMISIVDKTTISVSINDEIEDVILIFQKYNLESIPVIDNGNVLVGFITDNDIIHAISEETTDDIYKMYGITQLSQPYARTKVFKIVKSRIFWLILLMFVSTLTSAIIDMFTQIGTVQTSGLSTVFLIPIIPVITGASGNAGSQSAATLIRSLSIGEISNKDYRKVITKEFNVAIIIATILSLINYVRLVIYFSIRLAVEGTDKVGNPDIQISSEQYMAIAAVTSLGISISLFLSILLSKMIGSLLPIFAIKINVDPASMASPLLTTMIDTLTTTLLFAIGIGFLLIIPIAPI